MCGQAPSSKRAMSQHLRSAARLSRGGARQRIAGGLRRHRRAASPISRAGRRSSSASKTPDGEVTIAVVGKYTGLKDAYKSLIEALLHGGVANKVKVNIGWIESEKFEKEDAGSRSARRARHSRARRLRRARHGRQDRRAFRARARRRISASASACRWPASKPRAI